MATFFSYEIFAQNNSVFNFNQTKENNNSLCQLSFLISNKQDLPEKISGNVSFLRAEKNIEYYVALDLKDSNGKIVKIKDFYFKTKCLPEIKKAINLEQTNNYKNKMKRDFDCDSSQNKEISSSAYQDGILKIFSINDAALFGNISQENKEFSFIVKTEDNKEKVFKVDFADSRINEFKQCSSLLFHDYILGNATMEQLLEIRKNDINKKTN